MLSFLRHRRRSARSRLVHICNQAPLFPREAKQGNADKILVFAEGRVADEARRAGADIVGGPELADGVRIMELLIDMPLML